VTGPSTRQPVRAVIFDLDGTLVQTRVASWEIFSRISTRYGLGVTHPEQYFDLFRGNVFASIRELCRDDAHAAEVNAAFLTLLREEYTPPMVPGMPDVVRRLAGDCTLAVVSSNAMQAMRRILVANDLAFCFAHVFGGDVAPDKRAAIRTFLSDAGSGFGRRCEADYDETGVRTEPGPGSTVLVTDTAGDVRDALEVGIRVVGVAWGMHTTEELTAEGAEFVALWPQEVAAHLLGDAAAEPASGACAVSAAPAEAPRSGPTPARGCECGGRCGRADSRTGGTGGTYDAVLAAGRIRRDRRRAIGAAAAAPATPSPSAWAPASAPDASGELLAAIRRVCDG
jgi:phosphoglycolate phosphatase